MNEAASEHLDLAREYAARGDSYYWRVGQEIVAAQAADPTLSNKEIAKHMKRSDRWVGLIVQHVTTAKPDSPIDWQRGSHGTTAEIQAGVQKTLAEAPAEQIERIVAELPPERAAVLGAAALARPGVGNELARTKEGYNAVVHAGIEATKSVEEAERRRQRAERGGRKKGVGLDFLALVLGKLGKARRFLEESYQEVHEHELTDDAKEVLLEKLTEISQLAEWYRSYVETGDSVDDDELRKLLG